MTATSRADSKRMYSWWWDSHISPKNSKWLQENLTDMDAKVKQMIKLLEEDADSFARRAEMYYKKRPELMKLVEEFYRAYRALAERYDHATGALRQAHRTMAEAFPNQVPFVLSDDSPVSSAIDTDPRTPEMPPPIRALFDPDELQKDALGLSPQLNAGKRNREFTEEPNSVTNRRGLRQLNEIFGSGEAINQPKFGEGRVRKGLNFQDLEEDERNFKNNGGNDLKISVAEAEILTLKEALAKLEAEKEAGLLQYQQSLDRLSNLESEVSCAQEDSTRLNERASKAETEAQNLKEALSKLEIEREASLLQYQQCLDKVSILENDILNIQKNVEELTDRESKAENEAKSLKQSLAEVVAEKEAAHVQYRECLVMIANLEEKLQHAEENVRRYNELAEKAESELISLKQVIAKLTEEKGAAALQYQQCMEKISSLEHKISSAQKEVERLHREIDDGVSKLQNAEDKCLLLERSNLTLQSELESLVLKMGSQTQELTENQKELGRLWTCIQDEHLRFVEAETAFQTLQHLHSQTEEELRALAAELQNKTQMLKNLEIQNQGLAVEVQEIKNENRNLNELNMSSALSIKNLQDEVSSLREKIGKLEAEVELRTNERNALQQEIYCLKEEINDLNKKNGALLEQVESVGYDPECFVSSVKELQDENLRMKEICVTERNEKSVLLEKLNILEKLVEKNAFLENSISDMSVDLEEAREKVKMLEESCQSLLGEKSTLSSEKVALTSQLQITAKNLEKLSDKNVLLENSLSDTTAELEELRVKSKDLEDSCLLLGEQRSGLITEKESLLYQLDTYRKTLEDLEKKYRESIEQHLVLSDERESAFCEIEKLKASLDVEKQAFSSFTELNEKRLASMELQMRLLQEESDHWKREYEEELGEAVNSQFVIFILQNCMQDMKESIFSLLQECQKLVEASELSKEVISELEHENCERQVQVKSFVEQNKILRAGLHHVLRTLDVNGYEGCDDESEQDQTLLDHIFVELQERQNSLHEICDEYQHLIVEKFVTVKFLEQLKIEAANILMERNTLDQELRKQSEQISMLQSRMEKLLELNEELKLKVMEGNHKEEVLMTEMENVRKNLHNMEEAYQILHVENCKSLDEKISFTKEIVDLGKQKCQLEQDNSDMFIETVFQSQLSLICKDIISENLEELRKLTECMDKLQLTNNDLEERMKVMEEKFEDEQMKNLELIRSLEKSQSEAENYLMERNTLDQELQDQSEQNSTLQTKMEKLLELNEEITLKVMEGNYKEEVLMNEMDNVCKKLHNLEGAYQILQAENCNAVEDKISLTKEIFGLRKEKCELEEVNIDMLSETLFQSQLSFIYKDIVSENFEELRKVIECIDLLQFTNNDLEERVKVMQRKLGDEQTKNLELMKSLEKSKCEVLEVETMLSSTQNEKSKLHKMVGQLSTKCYDLEVLNEEKKKLIYKISLDKDCLAKETEFLREENRKMDMQLKKLHNEAEKNIIREESLTFELQMKKYEVQSWENQAATLFGELQISAVYESCFEGKVHELTEACENLQDRNNSKDMEIELLKDRISSSKQENGRLSTQLAAYAPAIQSLKDSISSLEKHTILCTTMQKVDTQEVKDSNLATFQHPKSCQQPYDDQVHHDGSAELQDLHRRILAIEGAFEEFGRQTTLEKLNANTKLEKIMKEIEEVKSGYGQSRESHRVTKDSTKLRGQEHFNGFHSKSEISEARNEVLTKDILLDQISGSSSYGIRRETAGAGDQMLELWESTDQDGSIDPMDGKTRKLANNSSLEYHQLEASKKRNSKHPLNESLVEKELGVDKLEISKRFSDFHQEGNKRRILERLDSDAQKLANLQITVQDLKKKMEVIEKGKVEKGSENDIVKGQVEEAEDAITKLFEMNHKLTKNIQDGLLPADGASILGPEENDSVHNRTISEQARRGSENIGRLQLELKKLQFLIMKLDDERESRGKSRVSERSPRVLLRDYLYGGMRTRQKHKKGTFCACMRPPTKGD